MAKDLLFKLRSVTLSNEERRRDIAAELEARGHLNERGKTFAGIVKANEYSRVSALNSAERGGNSRAKTVELQPALVREQAV
jgi:hypothetical protein